ncbi:MAG TPA: outer membrane protein transport protein [Limnobacter sp.]|uniref:OmpP1/FadL family transporter n=1 Tax=Limnobacter sp. TaxID=2003368 RepID=UPI002EDAF364
MHFTGRRPAPCFTIRALVAGISATFISSAAMAGGTAFDVTSISAMGNAQAGQAAEGGDASVIFANPAALTRFKRAELTQGAAFITVDSPYTSNQNNDGASTGAPQGQNGQVFDRNDGYDASVLAPNMYVAIPLSEKTVMGFSASGSHGLLVHYDANFPGRNQGRDIDFKVIRLNLGVGHKVSPTLSLGINGSYERYFQSIKLKLNYREAVQSLLDQNNAGALAGPANALLQTPTEEGDAKLRMFGWAFNAQVGALWEPTENTRFGFSYRPKTKFESNRGVFSINETAAQTQFRNNLANPNIFVGAASGLAGLDLSTSAGDLAPYQRIKQDITLPDELRLSVFHHATPKLDLMASYTRQDFSVTQLRYVRESNGRLLEDVPQNFKPAQSYRVGLNYKLYRRLTLKTGFATENSVVSDQYRITILPDSDRKYYSIGAQLDLSRDTALHMAYQKVKFAPSPVGNNDQITPPEVRGGDFKGTVQLDVNYFGIGITERF